MYRRPPSPQQVTSMLRWIEKFRIWYFSSNICWSQHILETLVDIFSWKCWLRYFLKILVEIFSSNIGWDICWNIGWDILCCSGKKLGGRADLGPDSSRQDLGQLQLQTFFSKTLNINLNIILIVLSIQFVYISNFRSSACLSSLWCRSWSISGMRPRRGWSTASPTTRTPPSKSTSPSMSDSWSISSSGYVEPFVQIFWI